MKTEICVDRELLDPIYVEAGMKRGELHTPTFFFVMVLSRVFMDSEIVIYIRYRTN